MGKRDKKADSANGSRSHGWTPKGGKGGSGLTPEQTAALQTVADEKLREQKAAERHEVATDTRALGNLPPPCQFRKLSFT